MSEQESYKDHEPVWLVKSGPHIVGPYTLFDLKQKVESREISLLDEVRTPRRRWSFVRETPLLHDVVLRVREQTSGEDKTGLMNEVTSRLNLDEITQPDLQINSASEVISSNPHLMNSLKKHASRVTNSTNAKKLNFSWPLIAILFAIAVVGFGINSYFNSRPVRMSTAEALKMSLNYYRAGDWSKAITFYLKAQPVEDPNMQMDFIPLFISENNLSEAKTLIQTLAQNKNFSLENLLRLENDKVLVQLKEGDFGAARMTADAILTKEPGFRPAIINRVISQSLLGDWETSWSESLDIQKNGIADNLLVAVKARALLNFNSTELEPNKLRALSEEISRWVDMRRDFRQEFLLMRSAILIMAGDLLNAKAAIQVAMNYSPDESIDFVKDPSLDYQVLSWKQFARVCTVVSLAFKELPEGLAANALCAYQQGDTAAALNGLQEGYKKFPENESISSFYAWLLMKLGKVEESKNILKDLDPAKNRLVATIKVNHLLQEKNFNSADIILKNMLSEDSKDPTVYYLKAQMALDFKQKDMARELTETGLAAAPNYKPLLKLKQDLSDEM